MAAAKTPAKAKPNAASRKIGRPSIKTPAILAAIFARMSQGEPLAEICRDPGMPAPSTVREWAQKDEAVSVDFARARADGFDAIAADALRIADTPLEGVRIKDAANGREVTTEDMLGHRKLQVETRLKLLAKWDPKRYGELIRNEVTGADGGPVETRYAGYSDGELDKLIADKLSALKK